MATVTDENKIKELLTRGVANVYPSYDEVFERFKEGKPLRIYLGIDATGSQLHLGHTVQLLFLKKLLDMGHKPVFLFGDFTSRIGDPTDKDAARVRQTKEQVQDHIKNWLEQVNKVLPVDKIEVQRHSDWYEKMSVEEFISIGYHTTVQQLLERDMFKRRMDAGKEIYTPETWYPILQGYDTVAMDVDGEVGGNDQTFNMLMGRTLMKQMKGKDKIVVARKLLEDPSTGKKLMSKTAGDYISLDASPQGMYGGIMAMADAAIVPFFESLTEVPMDRVAKTQKRLDDGENPKILKQELAHEITRMYHGSDAADKAQEEFDAVFKNKGTPDEMPKFNVGDGMAIADVLVGADMAPSKAEAKRLVEQGAVSMNDKKIETWNTIVKKDTILKIGAHRFLKLI